MPISTNRNNRCNFCSTFDKILDSPLPPIHSITRLAYGFTLGYNFNSFVFPYSGATDFLLPFPAAIDLESQIAFNLKKPPDLMMHGLFAVEGRVFCHSWNDDDPEISLFTDLSPRIQISSLLKKIQSMAATILELGRRISPTVGFPEMIWVAKDAQLGIPLRTPKLW